MKIFIILMLVVSSAVAGLVFKYRCGICGLYEDYAFPGSYKCPNDGGFMVPIGNNPFGD